MYRWKLDNIEILPIAFNIFYENAVMKKKKIIYSSEFSISEEFLDKVIKFIEEKKEIVAIDMEGATYSLKIFANFEQVSKNVIFFNVNTLALRQRMKEDLCTLEWSDDETYCVLNGQETPHLFQYSHMLNEANRYEYERIVKKVSEDSEGKAILLESADLYSNVYVNIKKLFLFPDDYYFVLFGMAKKIKREFGEFDAFISSSKNGAIIANLLGAMMNKKVIHIMGIGPQYSLRKASKEHEIISKCSYIYVFDFICTGMEMKVSATLINSNAADLIGGIGVAQYKKSNNPKDILLKKMKSLITINETEIRYKIAGTVEDLEILLQNT